jgi:hypothetical protein
MTPAPSPPEPRHAPHLRLLRRRCVAVVPLHGGAEPTEGKTSAWQASWADENIGDASPELWPPGANVGIGGTPEKAKADMAAEIAFAKVDDEAQPLLEALGELADEAEVMRIAVMRCGVHVRNTESAATRHGDRDAKMKLMRVAEQWRRAWIALTNMAQGSVAP